MSQNPASNQSGCKVDRIADEYGLPNLDSRLKRRREQDEASLRDLEKYVNMRILWASMKNAGMTIIDGQEENYHRLLTDDEVKDIARREAKAELEKAGIDVDTVLEDFVSYQTVRKHLNECMDISTSQEYNPDVDDVKNTFASLQARVDNVISRTINRLRNHNIINMGEPEVLISINIRCSDCGSTYGLNEILNEQRCDCREHPDEISDDSTEEAEIDQTAEPVKNNSDSPSETPEPQQRTLTVAGISDRNEPN